MKIILASLLLLPLAVLAQTRSPELLVKTTEALLKEDKLIGAQVLVGRNGKTLAYRDLGQLSPEDATPVDGETMFCIGSITKPFTSALILSMVDEGKLALDQPVDKWLPDFSNLEIVDGRKPEHAPTLRQLLSHRGGIYSQKRRISQHQANLLYIYDHTLEYAVDGIAKEKLIFAPGEEYAYSGAAYCVLGRTVEVTQDQQFEKVLRERISQPLGLEHTTYFPGKLSQNIAAGGSPSGDGIVSNPTTPHLAQPHLMQHTGGNLYSTAEDLAKFATMIANEARIGDEELLSRASWKELITEQYPKQSYTLGWGRILKDGETIGLAHSGSLASSRGLLRIDLRTKSYAIVLYTLKTRAASSEASTMLGVAARFVMDAMVDGETDKQD